MTRIFADFGRLKLRRVEPFTWIEVTECLVPIAAVIPESMWRRSRRYFWTKRAPDNTWCEIFRPAARS